VDDPRSFVVGPDVDFSCLVFGRGIFVFGRPSGVFVGRSSRSTAAVCSPRWADRPCSHYSADADCARRWAEIGSILLPKAPARTTIDQLPWPTVAFMFVDAGSPLRIGCWFDRDGLFISSVTNGLRQSRPGGTSHPTPCFPFMPCSKGRPT